MSWVNSCVFNHGPRSRKTTFAPPAARWKPGIAPPGPVPITTTSAVSVAAISMLRLSRRVSVARGARVRPCELSPVGEVREPPEPVAVWLREPDPPQTWMPLADRMCGVEVPGGVEGEERHRRERPPDQVVLRCRVEQLEQQLRAIGK